MKLMSKIKIFFWVFILVVSLLLTTTPVKIQAVSKTATPSAVISSQEVIEKMKERLENSTEEKINKVKGLITNKFKSTPFAYVGLLKTVDSDLLTLETKEGDKKVKVASDSAIVFVGEEQGKKTIKLKDVKINQFTIAMGFMEEDEIINAKRLIFSPMPSVTRKKVIYGKITEIDVNKIRVKNNGEETSFTVDSSTALKIKGIANPKAAEIQVEDKIVVILLLDKNDKITSCLSVFVLPGKYNPKAEENAINATPSAETSPSVKIEE